MERVLVIVNAERPSEDLFSITEEIKANGYNVSICCSKLTSEKTEKVKPDFHMEETLCLENYSGVIFMDDGGDEKKAIEIAEEANKSGIAIGGYGVGVHILNEAKLLDDKYVSAMSPIELSDKAKKVNSPSVRCENIVTSSGECATDLSLSSLMLLAERSKGLSKAKKRLIFHPNQLWSSANLTSGLNIGIWPKNCMKKALVLSLFLGRTSMLKKLLSTISWSYPQLLIQRSKRYLLNCPFQSAAGSSRPISEKMQPFRPLRILKALALETSIRLPSCL